MARALSLAVLVLSWSTPAHAWTDALVQTARARVEVEPSGRADVTIKLDLVVRAGWLEALEIAGLDPDAELGAEQVEFVSENGQRFRPSLRARGERTQIRFDRRAAPRRGHYQITVRYPTDLSARITPGEAGRIRVPWTMPGWQSGLEGVVVELVVPTSDAHVSIEDATASIETSRRREGDRTVLTWRRVHLPRTIPWTIAAELPGDALPGWSQHVDRVSAPEMPEPTVEVAQLAPRAAPLAILLIALLALGSIWAFDEGASRRRARVRAVLGRSSSLRSLGVLVSAAAGLFGVVQGHAPLTLSAVGLIVVLAAQRRAQRKAPALGRWRAPRTEDDDEGRALGVVDWLDATRARGVLLWLTLACVVGWVHSLDVDSGRASTLSAWLWACLCLPLLVASPRLIPPDPRDRLRRARRFAGQLRVRLPAPAIALTVHESAHGEVQDARIRLITEARPVGLLRLDVAFDDAGAAYGIMLTRQGSDAELQAAQRCDAEALRGPGGRIVRVVSVEEAIRLARRFKPTEKKKRATRVRRTRGAPMRLHA